MCYLRSCIVLYVVLFLNEFTLVFSVELWWSCHLIGNRLWCSLWGACHLWPFVIYLCFVLVGTRLGFIYLYGSMLYLFHEWNPWVLFGNLFMMFDDVEPWGTIPLCFTTRGRLWMKLIWHTFIHKKKLHVFSLIKLIQEF